MGRLMKSNGAAVGVTDASSDSVSEISNDDSLSGSKYSSFRFNKFGRKKKASDGDGNGIRDTPFLTTSASLESVSHDGTALTTGSVNVSNRKIDPKRLEQDAKSRFNVGIVYLQTGDYAKAQENLEHSLFCHIQVSGIKSKAYDSDAIYAIAGVREKLGDCFVANTAIVDKYLALDHYEESRRLLKCVHPEDTPDILTDMLGRVEEKLKLPELRNAGAKRKPPAPRTTNSEHIVRALGDRPATGKNTISRHRSTFMSRMVSIIDDVDEMPDGEGKSSEGSINETTVMGHLELDHHHMALNYLISLKGKKEMKIEKYQRQMADLMMKVAASAQEAHKISIATDAYEEARAIFKQDEDSGGKAKLALKGYIKGNLLQAKEMESVQDCDMAISHRTKVYQLLGEEHRTVPACQQKVKIAYLHGTMGDYAKSTEILHAAIARLHKGIKSVANMASNRLDLLIQCYLMQAICYAKLKKWNNVVDQYDAVLPLVLKKEGQDGKQYNSVLIHKSALLAMMGNYVMATPTINKYMKNAEHSNPDLIVDDLDHALALDIKAATHLKLEKVDKAISVFEMKLAFVKTLPNNHQMKSDTMHKLGCLLANDNQLESALPLLDEALRTKKHIYDGKHESVLKTTWAVAATNHMLGNNDKALEHYSILLDNMANIEDMPVDAAVIQHSAGKLFFEAGKVIKAVDTFRRALQGAKTSDNPQLESEITLNLANSLSGQEKMDEAMELYDQLLNTKSLKKTKISFMTRFNKCLLLIKMGEVDEAKEMLHKMEENPSSMANHVRGSVFLTLGNLAVSDGDIDEAMEYFDHALDEADDDDVSALVYTKRSIAMAQLDIRQYDTAISTLEDVLEDISYSDADGKSVNLLKAEIWNSLARVYRKRGDLQQAINFARLALQTYKTDLGEKNPITLRNLTNLQLLLLEEAEELVDYDDAKSISDAATYELEDALDAFESLEDPWTYRIDVATLKTNMGFVAVWQGKPKKARKLVCQIEEIELPFEHFLIHRIGVLGEHLEELEKTGGIKYDDVEKPQKRSNRKSKGRRQQSQRKSKRR